MTLWSDTCERHRDGVEMEKWLQTTECEDEGNAMSAWKMVPVEPTVEMIEAGDGENHMNVPTSYINDIWAAMLEVAPVLGFKPVAYVNGWYGGYPTFVPLNRAAVLPQGMALYAMPLDAHTIIEGLTRERDDWIACHAKIFRELQEAKSTVGNRCVEIEQLRAEVERLTKERDDLSAERQTYINLAHAAGQANMHMSTEVDRLTKLNSTMAAATVGLRAELAAAQKDSFSTKCKLVQIHDALISMSDTDPMLDDDMTDDEVREYEPVFWAAKEVAGLIGDSPWDRYTRAAMSEEKEAQP